MSIKKALCIILILCTLVATMTACEFAASAKMMTVNVNNGDKLVAKFATDKHVWDMDLKEGLFILSEDEETIFKCAFHDKDTLSSYIETIQTCIENDLQDLEVEDDGEVNGLKYTMVSFENDDGDTVYEVIGWIVGSNTGIVADSYDSEEFMEEILQALTFDVKDTSQSDSEYYFDEIEEIED